MKNLAMAYILCLGCTTVPPQGRVTMKLEPGLAHVSLRNVAAGDRIQILGDRCRTESVIGPSDMTLCHREILGEGFVVRVLNDRYAEVRFPKTIGMAEGQIVKRIN